jgi:hypothetical protein
MNISEYHLTSHYQERKQERGVIQDVYTAKAALEGYNPDQVKEKLKAAIQAKLNQALKEIESIGSGDKVTSNVFKIIKIFSPVVVRDGKEFTTNVKVNTSKQTAKGIVRGELLGNLFVCALRGNSLTTLMLVKDNENLEAKLKDHAKRIAGSNFKVVVANTPTPKVQFDIKELMEGKSLELKDASKQEKDLPYKVRTDYRQGANFTHDDYGTGKIANTSSGVKGQPNQQGKLDWVDVDFGKPFLKGGKMQTVRRIPTVYAKAYWLDKK